MIEGQKPLTLREFTPVSYAIAKNNLDHDRVEHERLISRRNALKDKMRSGLTTLNAGSLIAMLAALNGSGGAAAWVGISSGNAKWIAACFVAGLISAGASYRVASDATEYEIADSLKRVGAIERHVALFEEHTAPERHELLWQDYQKYADLPLVGHRISKSDIWSLSIAQGFWLAGIMIPLVTTVLS